MKHFIILAVAVAAGIGTSCLLASRLKDGCTP